MRSRPREPAHDQRKVLRMNKANTRKSITTTVSKMTEKQKRDASNEICQRLSAFASVTTADAILVYLPTKDEVDLQSLISLWIDESRTVCVPLIDWEAKTMRGGLLTSLDSHKLVESKHSIQEPAEKHPLPSDCIDVIIVPGIGFDRGGGRLGRGGGFYDKFLGQSRPPVVIGVCFDEQLVSCVPREQHDQEMNVVVTPSNVYFE
jgi:5-formyltetrahydrofolate cyclo-ligase